LRFNTIKSSTTVEDFFIFKFTKELVVNRRNKYIIASEQI